jgi:hypothetical protein
MRYGWQPSRYAKKNLLTRGKEVSNYLSGMRGISTCASLVASPGYFKGTRLKNIITGPIKDVKEDLRTVVTHFEI